MRILTRKLWRAFPELDSFDDDRCARFVRVACRAVGPSILRWGAELFIAVATLFGAATLTNLAHAAFTNSFGPRHTVWADCFAAVMFIAIGTLGVLCGLVVRDRLIRQRVAMVLKAGNRCPGCSYALLGLPVSETLTVDCPECGHHMRVDPALAELVRDDAGAVRLQPKPERRLLPWLTRRRVWFAVKCVLLIAACVGLYHGIRWVRFEWRVHADARLASTHFLGYEVLQRASERANPPDDGRPDGYVLLAEVLRLITEAEAAAAAAPTDAMKDPVTGEIAGPDYLQVRQPINSPPEFAEHYRRELYSALHCLDFIRRNGTLDALERMTTANRALQDWRGLVPNGLGSTWQISYRAERSVAKVCQALMVQSRRQGDHIGFLQHAKELLWMGAMVAREPLALSMTASNGFSGLAEEQLLEALATSPKKGLAETMHSTLGALLHPHRSLAVMFDVEAEILLDQAARLYCDVKAVKSMPKDNASIVNNGDHVAPGGYLDVRAAIERRRDELKKQSAVPPKQRSYGYLKEPSDSGLVVSSFQGAFYFMENHDLAATRRAGVVTLIAIIRYRDDTGALPKTLTDLVPKYLPAVPSDPAGDGPLRYKFIDPATDAHHREFLLYSVGPDGIDDGGVVKPGPSGMSRTDWPVAGDLIFNTPDKR